MKPSPQYILGTGLSHDGSTCIIKDGQIAIAIEKERLTRVKHDGGNDMLTVQYCLDALGITLSDLSLVVQVANFEKGIPPDNYRGKRVFPADMPVITISHHLAHAWSAVATSPFSAANVLVIDGSGSPAGQCDDWPDEATQKYWQSQNGFYCEKDSFYHYDGSRLKCIHKDFSEQHLFAIPSAGIRMPTNYHSIGGLYAAASNYCFGNIDDAGKLMGLAPYGRHTCFDKDIFCLQNDKVEIMHDVLTGLQTPAQNYDSFKASFQHYADVAAWVQHEAEKAIAYTVSSRMAMHPHNNLCYAGGVALNAVSNALLLKKGLVKNLYIQPAAADNGLAIGCALYGWCHVLKKEIPHTEKRSVFFGRQYTADTIQTALTEHKEQDKFHWQTMSDHINHTAGLLAAGKVIAWYRGGAEFGPRALGHRSILADPRLANIQSHINTNIKFREDFRPFAPAVLKEEVQTYFKNGWDSPYMILVDEIKEEWKHLVPGVVHVNGTCRVQTVDAAWNPEFHALLHAFGQRTGIPMLINTSFNRKGMPIVETPKQALDFFLSCALDVLVLDEYIITKKDIFPADTAEKN